MNRHLAPHLTNNLHYRLRHHNGGDVPHTAKFRPWQIKTAVAFRDKDRALSSLALHIRQESTARMRCAISATI